MREKNIEGPQYTVQIFHKNIHFYQRLSFFLDCLICKRPQPHPPPSPSCLLSLNYPEPEGGVGESDFKTQFPPPFQIKQYSSSPPPLLSAEESGYRGDYIHPFNSSISLAQRANTGVTGRAWVRIPTFQAIMENHNHNNQ